MCSDILCAVCRHEHEVDGGGAVVRRQLHYRRVASEGRIQRRESVRLDIRRAAKRLCDVVCADPDGISQIANDHAAAVQTPREFPRIASVHEH